MVKGNWSLWVCLVCVCARGPQEAAHYLFACFVLEGGRDQVNLGAFVGRMGLRGILQ